MSGACSIVSGYSIGHMDRIRKKHPRGLRFPGQMSNVSDKTIMNAWKREKKAFPGTHMRIYARKGFYSIGHGHRTWRHI